MGAPHHEPWSVSKYSRGRELLGFGRLEFLLQKVNWTGLDWIEIATPLEAGSKLSGAVWIW